MSPTSTMAAMSGDIWVGETASLPAPPDMEWVDKNGGSIEGAGDLIRGIAYTKGYTAIDQWRWAEDSWTA